MPYVPDPRNPAQPLDTELASTAAAEFRAAKLYLQARGILPFSAALPVTQVHSSYAALLHPTSDATARTVTIPSNATLPLLLGSSFDVINQNGAGVVTIAITTDTLRWLPTGGTGSRTLAANGRATVTKITDTEWVITGVGLT